MLNSTRPCQNRSCANDGLMICCMWANSQAVFCYLPRTVYHILRFGPTLIMGHDPTRFSSLCTGPDLFCAPFPLLSCPQRKTLTIFGLLGGGVYAQHRGGRLALAASCGTMSLELLGASWRLVGEILVKSNREKRRDFHGKETMVDLDGGCCGGPGERHAAQRGQAGGARLPRKARAWSWPSTIRTWPWSRTGAASTCRRG